MPGIIFLPKKKILTHIAVSDTVMDKYLVQLKRLGKLENINGENKKVDARFVYK